LRQLPQQTGERHNELPDRLKAAAAASHKVESRLSAALRRGCESWSCRWESAGRTEQRSMDAWSEGEKKSERKKEDVGGQGEAVKERGGGGWMDEGKSTQGLGPSETKCAP